MSTRRLAAIMFTDIEGYTKLMEEDEAQANVLRKRHREIFEHFHQQHTGEIVQYFGDGTLSIFDSCVESVRCGVNMQKAFKESPQVPLRIGIHLGDIEYTKTDVVGSGVNIASRVESLGISGAVLISDAVNQQIKNHGFEAISMGTFGMKNVARNMEVFAVQTQDRSLVIPNPKELKGKGKRLDGILQARQLIKLASIGFVAMVLGAVLFWASGAKEREQLLPESIREEKVGVAVFENRTDDESLNTLGYLASEWISSGLRELKVRTVSPEMVRQNKETIGILPNNSQNKPSFAEITGAKYVVAGSYFLEGDSIMLNTRLSSTETGEDVYIFPMIKGHKDHREKLAEEARQYLLGYWVLRRDQKLSNINPPKYEAYQAYLKCDLRKPLCWEKVLDIDPDFSLARVWLLYASGLHGMDSLYYSIKSELELDLDKLTEFERNIYKWATLRLDGNYQAAFEALDANYHLDSNDYKLVHETAVNAATDLNRTDITIQRYKRMFDNLHLFKNKIYRDSFVAYASALNREGKYNEVIQFYSSLLNQLNTKASRWILGDVIIALINLERMDEVWEIIEENDNDKSLILNAASIHAYIFPKAVSNPYADSLAKRIGEFKEYPESFGHGQLITGSMRSWGSRYWAYYILQDWRQAESELKKLDNYDWQAYYQGLPVPKWKGKEKLSVAASWACVYAHQGRAEEAYAKIKELEIAGKMYNDDTYYPYLRGMTPYLKARIYAVLGEKEKAVAELKKAIAQGKTYYAKNIYFDLDFVNLKGYSPFEALVAPKVGGK